jgi:hypothetical protein
VSTGPDESSDSRMEHHVYAVSATLTTSREGGTSTRGIPTFYLDARVQGILSEESARAVARSIIDPLGQFDRPSRGILSITAVAL